MALIILLHTFIMITVASLNGNSLRNMSKFEQVLVSVKADMLCFQETNWTDSKMQEIKSKWSDLIFCSHGGDKTCGVAILIKNDVVQNVKEIYADNDGRLIVIEFEVQNVVFRLINVYASNIESERREMFHKLKTLCSENCILIGDFNVRCSRMDASSCAKFRYDSSRNALWKLMNEENLVDIWRAENPNRRVFSRRQVVLKELKQSRIDLCLAKQELVQNVKKVSYTFTAYSDHAVMSFQMGFGVERRGGGVWCLNASLLKEEGYRNEIVECINDEMSNVLLKENVCLWWEEVKVKVKNRSIRYAKNHNRLDKQKEIMLRNRMLHELEKADTDPDYDVVNYLKIHAELGRYEKNKCLGAIVRSRAQYALEGEKCTSFFLGLEKRKQTKSYIVELEDERGVKVNDFVGILETVETFYRNLYKKNDVDKVCVVKVLDTISAKVSQADRMMCDEEISIMEIKEAIVSTQGNKSPGLDGLTNEFYKVFVDILAPILVRVFHYMEENKEIPESMSTGMLTILFKNRGSRLKLENYRPISLLNSDYKILTKVLANRMKKVIGSIIESTQAYGIPGRDIADVICTIRDVVNQMKNEGGIVLSLDFNKAFDRVEHSFLLQTLERFGFGPKFVSWINLLYSGAKSCVKCNGVLTDTFPVERSVRQGCPLSALLYSVSTEPLATLINSNKEVRGVGIPGGGVSVVHQYADDTTCTVKDIESIGSIMGIIDIYGKASGAKVNIEKTEIMFVGDINVNGCEIPFKSAKDFIKVLGVNIGVKEKEAKDITWTGILNKVKLTLNFWKNRKLKLQGKVIVANALVLSKFVYVLGVLDMPEWVLNELNNVVSNFIWDGKGVRISQKTLIADYVDGGLKLVDLGVKRKAIRIKTVKKYLYDSEDYGWKHFFRVYLEESGGCEDNGLLMGLKRAMFEKVPDFYKEVLNAWAELLPNVYYECGHIDLIMNQPIFLNEKIKNKEKVLYNKVFMSAGLRQIKDYTYEVIPGFLPGEAIFDIINEWDEEVGRGTVNNMYDKIKNSIPRAWVDLINSEVEREDLFVFPNLFIGSSKKKVHLSSIPVKRLYRIMVGKVCRRPAAEKFWKVVFPELDEKKIWGNLNVKYNSKECENNDFKLRHNRIFTKVVLKKINCEIERECDVCGRFPETLMHLFIECEDLKYFFCKVKEMLCRNWGGDFVKKYAWEELLLFGVSGKCEGANVCLLNMVLSFVRYAIFCRRNYVSFDRKRVQVWSIFIALFSKHIDMLFNYGMEHFDESFVEGSGLISREESGGITYNF